MPKRIIMTNESAKWGKAIVGDIVYYKDGKIGIMPKDNIDQSLKSYVIAIVVGKLLDRLLLLSLNRGEKIPYSATSVLVPNVAVAPWAGWDINAQVDDMAGKANTDALVSYYGLSASFAAGYCASYNVANLDWYLGGIGEFKYVNNNLSVIDSVRSALGYGNLFKKIGSELYTCIWTSTQCEATRSHSLRYPTGQGYDPGDHDMKKYYSYTNEGTYGLFGMVVYPMASIEL